MSEKKTPFYDIHKKLNAKIVPFAGYLMPVMYDSINAEHGRVRSKVGMFDISHMGEFTISGPGAKDFVQRLVTNDLSKLVENQIMYTCMCYEDGGIVDDILVYNFKDHLLLVINGSNIDKDFAHISKYAPENAELVNKSDETALIAIQGPLCNDVMARLCDYQLDDLKYYNAAFTKIAGEKILLSRTGYTGEDGFELYIPADIAARLWEPIYDVVTDLGGSPIGLGARDSLRLEMKFALYGNDISETTNPLEAGLGWVVKPDKGEFIGRDAIVKAKEQGLTRRLIGFQIEGKAFPRPGYVISHDGQNIGEVTSGVFSPSLQKGIGMGYVAKRHTRPGSKFDIEIRDKKLPAIVVKPPFYKRNT
ncbi:MAG: glycine cleavage system aminomethyltransferase GcvT [candidate division Zixibacteria bacterium]|nr:glycine cleavage system aminomethyltransferase GcvT [candidate division Zixibacteria bacterium]